VSTPVLNEDFRDLLAALGARSVEFVIVGAYAMAVHGVPRATGDIDILVRPTADNAVRVHAALVEFGAPVASHGLAAMDFAQPDLVYQLGLPPRRIDILTGISGVTFDEAWATRLELEFDGLRTSFLGREALIRNKRASARPKDLADLRLLEGR
jgi:hypothetical protein